MLTIKTHSLLSIILLIVPLTSCMIIPPGDTILSYPQPTPVIVQQSFTNPDAMLENYDCTARFDVGTGLLVCINDVLERHVDGELRYAPGISILVFDGDANRLWDYTIEGAYEDTYRNSAKLGPLANKASVDAQGNIYVAYVEEGIEGRNFNTDVVLLKFSIAGELLWKRRFDYLVEGSSRDGFGKMMYTDAGVIYLLLWRYKPATTNISGTNSPHLTLAIDPQGDILWQNNTWMDPKRNYSFFSYSNKIAAVSADGALYETHLYSDLNNNKYVQMLIKYNLSGSIEWSKNLTFLNEVSYPRVTHLLVDELGSVYIQRRNDVIVKYDSSGTEILRFTSDIIDGRGVILPQLGENGVLFIYENPDLGYTKYYKYENTGVLSWQQELLNHVDLDSREPSFVDSNNKLYNKLNHIDEVCIYKVYGINNRFWGTSEPPLTWNCTKTVLRGSYTSIPYYDFGITVDPLNVIETSPHKILFPMGLDGNGRVYFWGYEYLNGDYSTNPSAIIEVFDLAALLVGS